MGKTIWRTAPWQPRGEWLYADGTIEPGPLVETTSSQRRWRIAGTDMSVQKYDLGEKITEHMRQRARRAGTDLWLELDQDEDTTLQLHGTKAGAGYGWSILNTPEVSLDGGTTLPIAFEFVHRTYPMRVFLWIKLTTDRHGQSSVSSLLTYRPGDPLRPADHTVSIYTTKDRWWNGSNLHIPQIDFELERTSFGTRPRQAAARFLELLQQAVEVDTVSIPDGRDPKGRATLDFEFTRTNYTQDFYRQVLDVVQSGPAMERLAEHLKGIRRELSNLGLVAREKEGFDLKALLNGRLSEFQVQILPQDPQDAGGKGDSLGRDQHHTVHLDLANGVFVVSCSRHHLEEVAEQWNIAKFKAELTGETDVLMAYAQAYNEPAERARLRKVVNERRLPRST